MALALRRTYLKVRDHLVLSKTKIPPRNYALSLDFRAYSEEKNNNPDFSNSTILVENGFNVQELPVVIRKLKDLSDVDEVTANKTSSTTSSNYGLIQAEFRECVDLRDVFSLLSKCTKITPHIALGAMERIYDIEKGPNTLIDVNGNHINMAKGAILDKLLKVVAKTEDTQTILYVLKSISSFMEPFKYKFCDELLFRTIDNKMTIEQICMFTNFLIENKSNPKYADTIDKLWVGFVSKECDINEYNIATIFSLLPGLKVSKRIVLTLLEQKLSDLWYKIKVPVMKQILNSFVDEKYLSFQSFAIIGRWLHTNIHVLDDDSLLDIVSKITRLKYTDDQIEKALEKYMKLKGDKIESHVLIVGILNHCMQFQIRNKHILKSCSEYFQNNIHNIPPSFMKSHIYPYGFLYFTPDNGKFWDSIEVALLNNFLKINVDDLSLIMLSYIYVGKYPLRLASKVFSPLYLVKVNNNNNPEAFRNLTLLDTALSLECPNDYAGPFIPKDQWPKPVGQDDRIKNIVTKVYTSLEDVAGGADKLSRDVMVPNFSHKTYLIDVMFHPRGLDVKTLNWKTMSSRNVNVAMLVHLPDHYCSDNTQLIGPQVMKKKHLRLLGFKVVSVKYSIISKFYTSFNMKGLRQYLIDNIKSAEECL
ncbi:unnamed protein product [Diatraea saccharalis]|uniref:RAP domain-containing protein n=1 Tax=Diatraea saccharalis TaxID=40085 RepID=A0A9N9RGC9_9NEOP|nr:unnamed protein product [Diatraea saccharalis]